MSTVQPNSLFRMHSILLVPQKKMLEMNAVNRPVYYCGSECNDPAESHRYSHYVCYTHTPLNNLLRRNQSYSCRRQDDHIDRTDNLECRLVHKTHYMQHTFHAKVKVKADIAKGKVKKVRRRFV